MKNLNNSKLSMTFDNTLNQKLQGRLDFDFYLELDKQLFRLLYERLSADIILLIDNQLCDEQN